MFVSFTGLDISPLLIHKAKNVNTPCHHLHSYQKLQTIPLIVDSIGTFGITGIINEDRLISGAHCFFLGAQFMECIRPKEVTFQWEKPLYNRVNYLPIRQSLLFHFSFQYIYIYIQLIYIYSVNRSLLLSFSCVCFENVLGIRFQVGISYFSHYIWIHIQCMC